MNGSVFAAALALSALPVLAARIEMPAACTKPDGMTVDARNRLVVAAPNNDRRAPGAIFRIDAPGQAPRKWFDVPALAESGFSQPMGVCFGPEGELYVCDCQKAGFGRILRFAIKDDKPVSCEVVASGLANANGVKCRDGRLFVTQCFLDGEKPADGSSASAVFVFKTTDRNVRVTNDFKSPNCLFSDTTRNPKLKGGLNGLVFDSTGRLYVGNYGDGHVWRLTLGADGKVARSEKIVRAGLIVTPDGMCVDAKDNVYVADMFGDQAVKILPDGAVEIVRRGGFVRPSEPCVWQGSLYVANYGATSLEELPLK